QLRQEAQAAGRVDWRLAVDEAECRLLSDMDIDSARRVAEAGIALAPDPVPEPLLLPLLRLRACRAGLLLDGYEIERGEAELSQIVAMADRPSLMPARALALLERGLHRSRRSAYVEGQDDLLTACALLRAPGLEADLELCHGHLANHYKRVRDFDEALALL